MSRSAAVVLDLAEKQRDKRKRILRVAEALFCEHGLASVTMDEVARSAGVAKGTLYLYFQDKDELFFQAVTEGFEAFCELVEGLERSDLVLEEGLVEAVTAAIRFFRRRRALVRLMHRGEGSDPWRTEPIRQRWQGARIRLVGAVEHLLAGAGRKGDLSPDRSPRELAHFLLGSIRAQVRDIEGETGSIQPAGQTAARLVELFLSGARAVPRPKVVSISPPRGRRRP